MIQNYEVIEKIISQDENVREIYQKLDEMMLSELLCLWPIWKQEADRLGIKKTARVLMARLMQYCMIQKGEESCSLLQR